MKPLMLYVRQLGQRRTSAFHLLPTPEAQPGRRGHHLFGSGVGVADRPRTLREMFVDAEYDNDYLVDDTLRDDGL